MPKQTVVLKNEKEVKPSLDAFHLSKQTSLEFPNSKIAYLLTLLVIKGRIDAQVSGKKPEDMATYLENYEDARSKLELAEQKHAQLTDEAHLARQEFIKAFSDQFINHDVRISKAKTYDAIETFQYFYKLGQKGKGIVHVAEHLSRWGFRPVITVTVKKQDEAPQKFKTSGLSKRKKIALGSNYSPPMLEEVDADIAAENSEIETETMERLANKEDLIKLIKPMAELIYTHFEKTIEAANYKLNTVCVYNNWMLNEAKNLYDCHDGCKKERTDAIRMLIRIKTAIVSIGRVKINSGRLQDLSFMFPQFITKGKRKQIEQDWHQQKLDIKVYQNELVELLELRAANIELKTRNQQLNSLANNINPEKAEYVLSELVKAAAVIKQTAEKVAQVA